MSRPLFGCDAGSLRQLSITLDVVSQKVGEFLRRSADHLIAESREAFGEFGLLDHLVDRGVELADQGLSLGAFATSAAVMPVHADLLGLCA